MAPLAIEIARVLRRNPTPYLLAVAMASNAGGVATITGNPQNMIIGIASQIPYADFAARLAPVAAVGLVLVICLVSLAYFREFRTPFGAAAGQPRPRRHAFQIRKGLFVSLGVVVAFFVGVPIAEAAIVGGSVLLVSRAVNPRKIYSEIDGRLLLMFAGLFVVVAAAEKSFVSDSFVAAVGRLHLDNPGSLTAVTALLSNLVSNVPAVLALKPFVAALPDPHRAWLIIAMASTLSGNLTLVGSVANLIVVEQAKAAGTKISFFTYMWVGLPMTFAEPRFWPMAAHAVMRGAHDWFVSILMNR